MNDGLPLWLTEDVTWTVMWGLLVIGILGIIWFGTRQFPYLAAAVAIAGLIVAALVVEQSIVTDKEYLVQAVYTMADHVRNNDADGILQFVREDNQNMVGRIRSTMDQYEVRSCRLIGFSETSVDPEGTDPRKATVSFSVWGSGYPKGRPDLLQPASVAVTLEFQKIGGRWTIEDYRYRPSNAPDR